MIKENLLGPTAYSADNGLTAEQSAMLRDLDLDVIIHQVSAGDQEIAAVWEQLLVTPLRTASALRWRQASVQDALAQPEVIQNLYTQVQATRKEMRQNDWSYSGAQLSTRLYNQAELVTIGFSGLVAVQTKLEAGTWQSSGFQGLVSELARVLPANMMNEMDNELNRAKLTAGYAYAGSLTDTLQMRVDQLNWPPQRPVKQMMMHLFGYHDQVHEFSVDQRDEATQRAMASYLNVAGAPLWTVLSQLRGVMTTFLAQLETDLAFLVGAAHFVSLLGTQPHVMAQLGTSLTGHGLVNTAMVLAGQEVVPNDLTPTPQTAVIYISGANQGGKTTFLKALGQAVVLGQTGLPVLAQALTIPPYTSVATHFKRAETNEGGDGRLSEELGRLQHITATIHAPALVLMNESLASTNEHEAAHLNAEIIRGLTAAGISVVTVSHLFAFAQELAAALPRQIDFLRAQVAANHQRTYQLLPGQPQQTSHALDIYHTVFRKEVQNAV